MKHPFLTPILVMTIFMFTGIVMSSCDINKNPSSLQLAKVYVANEEGGSVSVIDLHDSLKNTSIDISDDGFKKRCFIFLFL